MSKHYFAPMVLVCCLIAATYEQVTAQVSLGPHAGYNIDVEELYFGSTIQFQLPARIGETHLIASPGFDFYPFFGPDVEGFDISASFFAFNFDLLYPFPTSGVEPYVGAGLVISRASVNASGLDPLPGGAVQLSNTDVGLNLKGGAFFGSAGSVRPFAEGILVVGSYSTLLLKGGVLFTIGR